MKSLMSLLYIRVGLIYTVVGVAIPCEPKPPIEDSSTVIIALCSLASLLTSSVSNGLQNLAAESKSPIARYEQVCIQAAHMLAFLTSLA